MKVIDVLEKMITTYEDEFLLQWKELSEDYKQAMTKGIVAFEIKVNRLEGKNKLSQNKTKAEQRAIINSFEQSERSTDKGVAEAMRSQLNIND